MKEDMRKLRAMWEETSYHLDSLQANRDCVDEERTANFDGKGLEYILSFDPETTPREVLNRRSKPRVAVIREEGSNGDREMASAFHAAGFEVWDVTMTDLLGGSATLDLFRGVVFVGGFSYADVLDSAKGWAGVIRFNKKLYEQFGRFYRRPDAFSLGVCNGCQLMALLGWVPWTGIRDEVQPRFIRNKSGRFESRFSAVRVLSSPSIMLKGMEGSTLGIWVAHGEGRLYLPEEEMMKELVEKDLLPLRFVDDNGEFSEIYPFNPNGSPLGAAALCSPDGRHLAMMPHPERTFLKWQWAYLTEGLKKDLKASPWLRMFQNARMWCENNPS
jgi:phosphoribosylformylglycinamidine synthase